jgi:hypothetical protein
LYKALSKKIKFNRKKLVATISLILIYIFVTSIIFIIPIKSFAQRYYNLRNGSNFQELLKEANDFIAKDKILAIHISKANEYLTAIHFFTMTDVNKISVLQVMRQEVAKKNFKKDINNISSIINQKDYYKIFDDVDYIISDTNFDGIFNGKKSYAYNDEFYVYDQNYLKTKGYVSFLGLARATRETLGRYFRINLRLPDDLKGVSTKFSFSFTINNYEISNNNLNQCSARDLVLYTLNNGVKTEIESEIVENEIFANLNELLTANGFLIIEGRLPESFAFPDGPCSLIIENVRAEQKSG